MIRTGAIGLSNCRGKRELEMYRTRLQGAQELDGELNTADYRAIKEKLEWEIKESTARRWH